MEKHFLFLLQFFYNLHSLKSLIQPFLILFHLLHHNKADNQQSQQQFQLLQNDDLNFQLLEMKTYNFSA